MIHYIVVGLIGLALYERGRANASQESKPTTEKETPKHETQQTPVEPEHEKAKENQPSESGKPIPPRGDDGKFEPTQSESEQQS